MFVEFKVLHKRKKVVKYVNEMCVLFFDFVTAVSINLKHCIFAV